jgi:hypothetical protein
VRYENGRAWTAGTTVCTAPTWRRWPTWASPATCRRRTSSRPAMDGYRQRDEQLRHVTPPSGGSGPFHLSVPAVRVELPCSVRDSCPGSEVPVARERAHWPCRRSAAPRRPAQSSFCAATSTASSAPIHAVPKAMISRAVVTSSTSFAQRPVNQPLGIPTPAFPPLYAWPNVPAASHEPDARDGHRSRS